jgi:hypothetical protein
LALHDRNDIFFNDKAPSEDSTDKAAPMANAGPQDLHCVESGIVSDMAVEEHVLKELLCTLRPREDAMVRAPEAKHQPAQALRLLDHAQLATIARD